MIDALRYDKNFWYRFTIDLSLNNTKEEGVIRQKAEEGERMKE